MPCVPCDGFHIAEHLPPPRQSEPLHLGRNLQPALTLPVLPDPGCEIGDIQIRRLYHLAQPLQTAPLFEWALTPEQERTAKLDGAVG